ncbi:T9SS type A sorting domain-containing protein [Winogradskyella costae]|uniref:T9SS type A sorting domain-containing protein n=1 Tax=Winogradskyella costae TaxID=2697008 RepID=UPI0015C7DE2D|nr:T9SS type A sorting domain-containing protein [Winogradskyella costae]
MKKIYFLLFTLLFTAASSFAQVVINEIDVDTPGSDTAEFVELKAAPNTSLDGYIVVFFNGGNDSSYGSWSLTGKTTDANGFFILANTDLVSGSDIDLPPGGSGYIQNGADAIAIYQDDIANFPNGTAPTMTNLIDAIVYGTSDGDDAELLTGLGETVQYDEDLNGAKDTESLQLNAAGTAFNTKAVTFRDFNDAAVCALSLSSTSAVCDAFTPGTDTYTATVDFSGGGTASYTVTANSGTVDFSSGNPSTDATGTITVTGVAEGTDVIISVVDGALCDLSSTVTSPECLPSNTLPLYEGFDYTVGNDLGTEANWNNFSGTANPIDVVSGSLSYTGLVASTGESVFLEGGAIDSELTFTPVTSGDVFASFIINVSDLSNITDTTDGGYVVILGEFDARLWIHPDTDPVGTTYDIALTNSSSGENFSTTKYNVGDDVLIVMSYNIETGAINGWINPAGTDLGGSAPAATLTDTDASPSSMIDTFALRQDSTGETPAMIFDELRIGTSWADVTPSTLSLTNVNRNAFSIYPNPATSGIVNISSTNSEAISVQVFDILGKQVKNQTLTNNTLNVANLKSGIYIVKITQNNTSTTKKLVIK